VLGLLCEFLQSVGPAYLRHVTQLATGHAPFHDLSQFAAVLRITNARRPPRPTDGGPNCLLVTDALWATIQACWAQNAAERPTTVDIVSQLASMDRAIAAEENTEDSKQLLGPRGREHEIEPQHEPAGERTLTPGPRCEGGGKFPILNAPSNPPGSRHSWLHSDATLGRGAPLPAPPSLAPSPAQAPSTPSPFVPLPAAPAAPLAQPSRVNTPPRPLSPPAAPASAAGPPSRDCTPAPPPAASPSATAQPPAVPTSAAGSPSRDCTSRASSAHVPGKPQSKLSHEQLSDLQKHTHCASLFSPASATTR
jgi:hypothetical protein